MTGHLFLVPPRLTERQQVALDLTAGDGATDLEVGVELHARKGCGYCREHQPCEYAASTGREVLVALRKKGLVVRRRSGLWQHVGTATSAAGGYDPATAEIPF